jgi:hypothetical protein
MKSGDKIITKNGKLILIKRGFSGWWIELDGKKGYLFVDEVERIKEGEKFDWKKEGIFS